MAARDLNGDDLPDIAVANYNSDDVVVMLALVTGPCNDIDGDGYGDPASPECPYPHRDCDDIDPNVNPGVDEVCDNLKDDDCDGFVDGDDPDCNQDSCFIATAAFGTARAGRIDAIRTFRDEYLLTNANGRAFVKAYYRYSPPIARYIEQRAWLRKVIRTLLLPLIGFATLLC